MKEPKLRFKADDGSKFPDWESKTINSFATCIAGATPSTKINDYWENGNIPWMSSGEVNKELIFDTDKKITKLGYQKASTKMVPANTVVMALAGQGKTRGRVALTKIDLCTNQSLCSILNNGTVNSVYLYQYLKTQYNNLRQISSGEGTRGGLNLQLVGNFTVQVPSLPEQKKIADFLSAVDARISEQEAYVADLKERKKGFLQQIFSRKLRFKTDDGNEFPGWEEKRLKEVASEFKSGKNIKADQIFNDGKYPVYGGNGLRGFTDHFNHDGEYALIGRQGALCGNMNYVSGKCYLTEHAVAVQGNEANDTKFLYYLLAVMNLGQYSGQSAQPGLAVNRIIELTNLFPSLPEQKKIADFFSALDEQIANEQAILDDWKLLKKGLLQQMFV